MKYYFDFQIYDEIKVQYEALEQYCLNNAVSNPVIFIDDNYMGADANRIAYQAMLKQMKSGKIKRAIFYSDDRI